MSNDDHLFFVAETARLAREMSVRDARRFLNGCLLLLGDTPEASPLRAAFTNLYDSDRQLELIASGQMRLPISQPPSTNPPQL